MSLRGELDYDYQLLPEEPQPGVIRMPLPEEVKLALATEEENYFKLMFAFLGPIDKLTTVVLRWPGVVLGLT